MKEHEKPLENLHLKRSRAAGFSTSSEKKIKF